MASDASPADEFHFEHAGFCELCGKSSIFVAKHPYLRNSLQCTQCKSIPRQRAIWHYLNVFAPRWRDLAVHESSPGGDKVSQRLSKECSRYIASQYDVSVAFGALVSSPQMVVKSYISENLEAQTFESEKFDIVITQDVFEHVFHPDLAIKEIARTLKVGGLCVMTVPIVNKRRPSQRRAKLLPNGEIVHLLDAQYHGNPMSKDGSLVTIDWGYDISAYLQTHSGLAIMMLQLDNIDIGIRADLNEVIVGFKQPIPRL